MFPLWTLKKRYDEEERSGGMRREKKINSRGGSGKTLRSCGCLNTLVLKVDTSMNILMYVLLNGIVYEDIGDHAHTLISINDRINKKI